MQQPLPCCFTVPRMNVGAHTCSQLPNTSPSRDHLLAKECDPRNPITHIHHARKLPVRISCHSGDGWGMLCPWHHDWSMYASVLSWPSLVPGLSGYVPQTWRRGCRGSSTSQPLQLVGPVQSPGLSVERHLCVACLWSRVGPGIVLRLLSGSAFLCTMSWAAMASAGWVRLTALTRRSLTCAFVLRTACPKLHTG